MMRYWLLQIAYQIYKIKKILKERGRRDTAFVIQMWTTDWIKYRFTFKDVDYKQSVKVSSSEWNQLSMESPIEIIFDPRNPKLYNLRVSVMGTLFFRCCGFFAILSIGLILGLGLGFGIGFGCAWYQL